MPIRSSKPSQRMKLVESSDEGLMTEHIETRFNPVLTALETCDLPRTVVVAWCAETLKTDRVGLICDQRLRGLCATPPTLDAALCGQHGAA